MNKIPTARGALLALALLIKDGLIKLAVELGILQITAAQFATRTEALTTTDAEFNSARTLRQAASKDFQAKRKSLNEWLFKTRNVLAGQLGNDWSTEWAQAGFVTPSKQIPS